MSFVQAKCTNCGGVLEVDNAHDAAICKYCGTPFVVEKAVNNYVQNFNIQNATINVQGPELNNYLTLIDEALKTKNLEEAEKYLSEALPLGPENPRLALYKIKIKCIKLEEKYYTNVAGKMSFGEASVFTFDTKEMNSFIEIEVPIALKKIGDSNPDIKDEVYLCLIDFLNKCFPLWANVYLKAVVNEPIGFKTDYPGSTDNCKSIMMLFALIQYNILMYGSPSESVAVKMLDNFMNINDAFKAPLSAFLSCSIKPDYNPAPPEVKIKDKNGNEKTTLLLGSIWLYLFKQRYPDYKSDNLDKLSNLMDKLEFPKVGCYVATCVYGSYDCPEVWTLRRFRDYTLDKTWYGRAFIKTYYAISPKIVEIFGDYSLFKNVFKRPLDRMVKKLSLKGYENTPYDDKY